MLFQTLHYVIFLILVVGVYWSVPYRFRLHILGISSLVFYGSWNANYLPLLMGISLLAWGVARLCDPNRHPTRPTWQYLSCIFFLFVPLMLFKYWSWSTENLEYLASYLGYSLQFSDCPSSLSFLCTKDQSKFILPIGISFFTFQAVSYVIDVRKKQEEEKNPWRFLTFISFFPQLIAGPIVRQHELLPQLKNPILLAKNDIGEALYRIIKGLVKKLLFADILHSGIIKAVFDDPESYIGIELWIALYAYTIWIYYDFSAYTDIAIGSARLFGIHLPENFDRPYNSTSIAEFWRKWHITLSNWIRDYIYYPLGGAKTDAEWKAYRNLMVTMVVIGIWHGASWNFVIYGILHGSAVGVNRWLRKQTSRRPGDPHDNFFSWLWRFLLTFHFVVVARILFGTHDLTDAWHYFTLLSEISWEVPRFYNHTIFALLVLGYIWHFTPKQWTNNTIKDRFVALPAPIQAAIAVACAVLCWKMNGDSTITFAYYQF